MQAEFLEVKRERNRLAVIREQALRRYRVADKNASKQFSEMYEIEQTIIDHARKANWKAKRLAEVICCSVTAAYMKLNPDKLKATMALKSARRSGSIRPPDKCEKCSRQTTLHGHHPDYSNPDEIIWLCPKCHRREHTRKR